MISLYGVSKRYNERGSRADQGFEALSSVSLEVGQERFTVSLVPAVRANQRFFAC